MGGGGGAPEGQGGAHLLLCSCRFDFLQSWHQFNSYYEFKKSYFLQKAGRGLAEVRRVERVGRRWCGGGGGQDICLCRCSWVHMYVAAAAVGPVAGFSVRWVLMMRRGGCREEPAFTAAPGPPVW